MVYAKFQRFDRCYRWAGSCLDKDTTLPYDIRAEINWHDFACTANPLGAPERIKDAIASAIAEGAMTFRPDKAGVHLSNNLARYYEISPERFLAGTSPSALIADIAQAYRPCNVGIPTPAPSTITLLLTLATIRSSS